MQSLFEQPEFNLQSFLRWSHGAILGAVVSLGPLISPPIHIGFDDLRGDLIKIAIARIRLEVKTSRAFMQAIAFWR